MPNKCTTDAQIRININTVKHQCHYTERGADRQRMFSQQNKCVGCSATCAPCAPAAGSLYKSKCHMSHRKASMAPACGWDRRPVSVLTYRQTLQTHQKKITLTLNLRKTNMDANFTHTHKKEKINERHKNQTKVMSKPL